MDKVFHPRTGENGFFLSETDKKLIDVALIVLANLYEDSSLSEESGVLDG